MVAVSAAGTPSTNRSSRAEQLGRSGVDGGQRADRAAQLPHRRRGVQPAADDVADHDGDPVGVEEERVVPVAADLQRVDRRPVARRQPEPRVVGHAAGQHAVLQGGGDAALLVVQPGPLEGQAGLLAEGLQQPELLGVGRAGCAEPQGQHAERPVERDERRQDEHARPGCRGPRAAAGSPLRRSGTCTTQPSRSRATSGRLSCAGGRSSGLPTAPDAAVQSSSLVAGLIVQRTLAAAAKAVVPASATT